MKNLEAIQSYGLLNYPVSSGTYNVALINAGINPTDEYTVNNQMKLELCVADLLLMLITSAKSISDDGYKVDMQDIPELWRLRAFWRKKWGLPDDTPILGAPIIIKNGSNKW